MNLIYIQPTPALRQGFARWAVAQDPKVRTATAEEFAVPADLFAGIPELVLIGALVDGHRYISPEEDQAREARLLGCGLCFEEDGQEVHPHPECTVTGPDLLGVATPGGLHAPVLDAQEAVPGDVLLEVTESAYGPHAVALDFAPPEDTTAEAGDRSDEDDEARADGHGCNLCERSFETERGRDTHRRMVHTEEN